MAVDLDDEKVALEPAPMQKGKAKMDLLILHNLSKKVEFPSGLIKSEAINVYGDRWRVNLWTFGDNNAKVEQSWFVVADPKGTIVSFS